jgi:hypothetical protein
VRSCHHWQLQTRSVWFPVYSGMSSSPSLVFASQLNTLYSSGRICIM